MHSQLARRVVQEVELVAERIKSWPVASRGGPIASWDDVPVQRLSSADLRAGTGTAAHIGPDARILAALDLSPGALPDEPVCTFVPAPAEGTATPELVPLYRLSAFFRTASLPPDALRSFRPRPGFAPATPPETRLLAAALGPIDEMRALLARRFERERPAGGGTDAEVATEARAGTPPRDGEVVLLVAPRNPRTPGEKLRAEVLVPLAVALRRIHLWTGEGWT